MFKVALGVMPDYLFDGKGMRIDGITEDRPAAMAGLQKGDVVIQLGDSLVTDMMSYMRALSSFEKGNTTKVIVDRKGEKIDAEITF
jgi:S1-C subfamily serine protease